MQQVFQIKLVLFFMYRCGDFSVFIRKKYKYFIVLVIIKKNQ